MTDNRTIDIMQADIQANGPVPNDPREAYMRGIAATLGSDGVDVCKPIEAHDCLSGTDCPAWRCSVCGELFEAGANFCSNCGAKVVSE